MLNAEFEAAIEEKRKDKLPYDYYKSLIKDRDPMDISIKSTCPYDPEKQLFTITLMSEIYLVKYPEGDVLLSNENTFNDYKLMTMILRYLLNAQGIPPMGTTIAYRDISGGNHYFKSFEGRCLKRFAFTFNNDSDGLKRAMEKMNAEPQRFGDLSYRFEFIDNMYLTVILWLGDDEFPPESQILFDSNITSGFDAEDLAVMGDIFIPILKKLARA
ncbi:MAG: DUF3786 domain-containing protein [Eubacterium sp.]